jgi:hypothetical protein
MGENPEPFAECAEWVRQIFIAEGERDDETYRSWQEGLDLSFRQNERVPEPVLEATPLPPRAAAAPTEETTDNRIIGEDDRRRVVHQKVSSRGSDYDSDAESKRFEDIEFANFLRSV